MRRWFWIIAVAATVALAEKRDHNEWQPQHDIAVVFRTNTVNRVVFSHERHFGALAAKDCAVCHAESKQLVTVGPRPSVASNPQFEPHGATSRGRFCASCHDGKVNFSALGRTGDALCARCHAPEDHGADFTKRHGDMAEHGGGARCEQCHRGARSISPVELQQAGDFFKAQASLAQDPQDKAAFQKTLPNNFCAYCHTHDREPWDNGKHDD